ncbi:hypothetical protein bcf_27850 (plasmid) [Bacillus cereus F837/76]|nr:hypothetical protein bcf_27850 [Bacillus cereus F837/76]
MLIFLKFFVSLVCLGIWAIKREYIILDIDWRIIKDKFLESLLFSLLISTIFECFHYIVQTIFTLM